MRTLRADGQCPPYERHSISRTASPMLIPVSSRSRSPRWVTLLRQVSPLLAVVAVFFGTLSALGQPKPDPAPVAPVVNAAPAAGVEPGPAPSTMKDPSLWELFLKGG